MINPKLIPKIVGFADMKTVIKLYKAGIISEELLIKDWGYQYLGEKYLEKGKMY